MAILAGIVVWSLYLLVSTARSGRHDSRQNDFDRTLKDGAAGETGVHRSPWMPPPPPLRSIALIALALAVVAIVILEWALLLMNP